MINQIDLYINEKFIGAFYNLDESIITTDNNTFMLFWGDDVPHQAFCIANVKIEKKIINPEHIEYYLTKTI